MSASKFTPASPLPALSRRSLLKRSLTGLSALQLAKLSALSQAAQNTGLADAFADAFYIGVAVASSSIDEPNPPELELIAQEFNSVVAENAMKWERIRPDGKTWFFERADKLVDFATANDMYMVGHNLVWHSQVPTAVFHDEDGKQLSRPALLELMQAHISTLVGRYKGRVHAWDVVNEGIDEDQGWRRSLWYQLIGPDYMEQALRFAHAADPDASLLYNDYNMHLPGKRAFLLDVIRDYQERGVPLHGVGLQGHVGLNYPDLQQWEDSIAAYAELGLEVHISELEIDVLPNPYQMSAEISTRFAYSADKDPYREALPAEVQQILAERYTQVFNILLKYRDNVKRVALWGLHDGISWKNDFPIEGRTNHPLLFDRELHPKPAYFRLMDLASTL